MFYQGKITTAAITCELPLLKTSFPTTVYDLTMELFPLETKVTIPVAEHRMTDGVMPDVLALSREYLTLYPDSL